MTLQEKIGLIIAASLLLALFWGCLLGLRAYWRAWTRHDTQKAFKQDTRDDEEE